MTVSRRFPDRKIFLAMLVVVLLGACLYANVVRGAFIWDDELLVKKNLYIRHWPGAWKLFSTEVGAGSGTRYGYYRPLQLFSYAIEYALWKDNPAGYHSVNIGLHCLIGLGVFFLIRLLYADTLLAFLGAVLFACHPVQTESVSYISDRGDLLCAFFFIAGFIFYIRFLRAKRASFYLALVAAYIFALLSKENALVFIPALLVYHWSFRQRLEVSYLVLPGALTVAYLALRGVIIREPLPPVAALLGRLPGSMAAFGEYLRLLFFPFGLHFAYANPAFSLFDPAVLAGAAFVVMLTVLAAARKRKDPVTFFAVCWFFVTLLPFLGIYPSPAFYMAEHALYLPSVGFVILCAYVLARLARAIAFRKAAAFAAVLLVALYSVMTVRQNAYWLEPESFYLRTIQLSPASAEASYNLANIYRDRGDRARAAAYYRKAIEADRAYVRAYVNLAIVSFELGDLAQTSLLLERALALAPDNPEVLYNMAVLHYYKKEYDAALACLDRVKDFGGYTPDRRFLQALESRRPK